VTVPAQQTIQQTAVCIIIVRQSMYDTRKIDRVSARFLRWLVLAALCLIGLVVGVFLAAQVFVGIVAPEPAPQEMIDHGRRVALWLLPVTVCWFLGWFMGVAWIGKLLSRRAGEFT